MSKEKPTILKDIDAVIFDLDGSLVDSMWIWPAVDEAYLKKYHLTEPEHFHEGMEGKSYTEVAQYFLEIFPELDCTIEDIKQEWTEMVYEAYTTQVKLKEGAYDFISILREEGMKFGIATSNARELTEATLEALKIDGFFDSVHTACEVKTGKPSPDVYLLVADELKIPPEKCLVFEDVPMGIMAGKNAGMKVCAVEDDFSRPQEMKKRELADYYIMNYNDIKNGTYEVL